jgi:hypothetical protein
MPAAKHVALGAQVVATGARACRGHAQPVANRDDDGAPRSTRRAGLNRSSTVSRALPKREVNSNPSPSAGGRSCLRPAPLLNGALRATKDRSTPSRHSRSPTASSTTSSEPTTAPRTRRYVRRTRIVGTHAPPRARSSPHAGPAWSMGPCRSSRAVRASGIPASPAHSSNGRSPARRARRASARTPRSTSSGVTRPRRSKIASRCRPLPPSGRRGAVPAPSAYPKCHEPS